MRKDFPLTDDDAAFLNSQGYNWEAVTDRGNRWVIIHGFPVPQGYNTSTVNCAIQIPSGYPDAMLDMAYFYPWLKRLDGIQIGQADVAMQIGDLSYQRWSRHYQWQPNFHNLGTHIMSIKTWLEQEFVKKPMQGAGSV